MSNPDYGVVYVTAGVDFVREAVQSARSVKQTNPEIPISIVSDITPTEGIFDNIFKIENPQYGFGDKPLHMQLPYDRTLFLDTDIHVDGDLMPVFTVLDEFDIAVSHNNGNKTRNTYTNDSIPRTFPEYNTGVIAFNRNDRVVSFLDDWKRRFQSDTKLRPGDQPSFRVALYESDLRIATLPAEYNCLFRYPGHVIGNVVCYHGRIGDTDSEGAAQQYSLKSAKSALSKSSLSRVFVPTPWGTYWVLHGRTLVHRIRTRWATEGIEGLLKEIANLLR